VQQHSRKTFVSAVPQITSLLIGSWVHLNYRRWYCAFLWWPTHRANRTPL